MSFGSMQSWEMMDGAGDSGSFDESELANVRTKRAKGREAKDIKQKLSLQYDPAAKVQTGPGVPNWSWRTVPLRWSGPVTADHSIRLVLLGPLELGVLAALRVALFVLLGFGFAGAARRLRPPPAGGGGLRDDVVLDDPIGESPPEDSEPSPDDGASPSDDGASVKGALSASVAATAVLLLLGALVPHSAYAQEDPQSAEEGVPAPPVAPAVLDLLEQRVVAGPACRPDCVTVSRASVSIRDDVLRIEATVHAGDHTSWPLPGPATTWVPRDVTLDGRPTRALARKADGHLHMRVDPGVHDIVVEGALPPGDALTLRWGLVPQQMD